MENPQNNQTISVVIPTFNRDFHLEETLVSLANQTMPLHEIVVVDDGGNGSARAVVERFGSRFRYVWKTNGGTQSARNLGVEQSTGDWIAFLDDDDLWEEDRHEMLRQLISTNQVDVIFSDMRKFGADGLSKQGVFEEISARSPGFFDGILQAEKADFAIVGSFPTTRLFPLYPFWPSAMAISRELQQRVGCWDIALRQSSAEDFDYVFRALKVGRLGLLWKPGVRYRCHSGNFSADTLLKSLGRVHVWEHLLMNQSVTPAEERAIVSAIQNGLVEVHWAAFAARQFETVIDVARKIGWNKLSPAQKVKTLFAQLFLLIRQKEKGK